MFDLPNCRKSEQSSDRILGEKLCRLSLVSVRTISSPRDTESASECETRKDDHPFQMKQR